MKKYILISQQPKGVLKSDNIVGLIGTESLVDYDVVIDSGNIASFRTYLLDDYMYSGALNVNLVLSSELADNQFKAKTLFLESFVKAFEELTISTSATVTFYPPMGISIGTISA